MKRKTSPVRNLEERKKARIDRENEDRLNALSVLAVPDTLNYLLSYVVGKEMFSMEEGKCANYRSVSLVSKAFNEASRRAFRRAYLDERSYYDDNYPEKASELIETFLERFPNVTKIVCHAAVTTGIFSRPKLMRISEEGVVPVFKEKSNEDKVSRISRITSLNVSGEWHSFSLNPKTLSNLKTLRLYRLGVYGFELEGFSKLEKLSMIGVFVKRPISLRSPLKSLTMMGSRSMEMNALNAFDARFANDEHFEKNISNLEEFTLSRDLCSSVLAGNSPFPEMPPNLKKLVVAEGDRTENQTSVTIEKVLTDDEKETECFSLRVPIYLPMSFEDYLVKGVQFTHPEERKSGEGFKIFFKTWKCSTGDHLFSFLRIASVLQGYFTSNFFNWKKRKNVLELWKWCDQGGRFPYQIVPLPGVMSDEEVEIWKFFDNTPLIKE